MTTNTQLLPFWLRQSLRKTRWMTSPTSIQRHVPEKAICARYAFSYKRLFAEVHPALFSTIVYIDISPEAASETSGRPTKAARKFGSNHRDLSRIPRYRSEHGQRMVGDFDTAHWSAFLSSARELGEQVFLSHSRCVDIKFLPADSQLEERCYRRRYAWFGRRRGSLHFCRVKFDIFSLNRLNRSWLKYWSSMACSNVKSSKDLQIFDKNWRISGRSKKFEISAAVRRGLRKTVQFCAADRNNFWRLWTPTTPIELQQPGQSTVTVVKNQQVLRAK